MKIPFHKTYIGDREKELVLEALNSGWITMGPKTIEFENMFKNYCRTDYAVSFNSATAAMHLALKAIGLKEGDEVIIPTNTFVATAEVITYFNATPVLVDIEYDTHNIDVNKIEKLITTNTKAIIPVHFGGQICDMDEINSIAETHNLKVIEDAAHCLPSNYKGKKIGNLSDITCFSFYATKTLATGEGGMATTNNSAYAKSMKINRLHGISSDAWDRYTSKGSWFYEIVDNGYKYNTTDINAALGIAQLEKIDVLYDKRKKIASYYDKNLNSNIEKLQIKSDRDSSYHLYVIKVNNRNELFDKLKTNGITTSVHFIPIHQHTYYKKRYSYEVEDYPIANDVFKKSLSLPIFPSMSFEELDFIVKKINKYAK